MKSINAGAVLAAELSNMVWEIVLENHPEKRDELEALWREIRNAATFVLTNSVTHTELLRRAREQIAALEFEEKLGEETRGYNGKFR